MKEIGPMTPPEQTPPTTSKRKEVTESQIYQIIKNTVIPQLRIALQEYGLMLDQA